MGYFSNIKGYAIDVLFKRLNRTKLGKLSFEKRLNKTTPILIYQMGKVGSLSIYQSLQKQYSGVVLHLHNFWPNTGDPFLDRIYKWVIYDKLPIKIISLTREPIIRNISSFFQNFKRDTGTSYKKSSFSIDELQNIFLTKRSHNTPLIWFDENINKKLGIDIYLTPFPENGFCTYSKNNIDLLVMRSEISDNKKDREIKRFIGLKSFTLCNTNIGEKKDYAKMYNDFKEQVKLPLDYIEWMCKSKYFNHFYSNGFINETRKKWTNR